MATKLQVWNATMIFKNIVENNQFDSIKKVEAISKVYKALSELMEGYRLAIIKVHGEGVKLSEPPVLEFLNEQEDTSLPKLDPAFLEGIGIKGGDYLYLRDAGVLEVMEE